MIWAALGLGVLAWAVVRPPRAPLYEVGRWHIDGRMSGSKCVRCGRPLKRAAVRVVLDDDPTVALAAGPTCARKLAAGEWCDRCDQVDDLPDLPGERPDCCSTPYKEWSATGRGGLTYGEAADAVYTDSFARSRRGEPGLTVSHSRIVKVMGKAKRAAYKHCQTSYCDTSRVGGAYVHKDGGRYLVTETPDRNDRRAAVVASRRGVVTATGPDGESLYSGPDLDAAVRAAVGAVEDPFAPSYEPASTTDDEVPF